MKDKVINCPKHGEAESYLKDTILLRYACKDCWEEEHAEVEEDDYHYHTTFFED